MTRFSSRSSDPDRSRCARFSLFVFDTIVAEQLRHFTRTMAVHGGAIHHHHHYHRPCCHTYQTFSSCLATYRHLHAYVLYFCRLRYDALLHTSFASNVLTSQAHRCYSRREKTLLSGRVDSGSAGEDPDRVSRERLDVSRRCSSLAFLIPSNRTATRFAISHGERSLLRVTL